MPPDPLILGFDTAAAHCAAALLRGTNILAVRSEPMLKGQAERLFPLLEEMLSEQGLGWSDLNAIGVGIGPGNFTGIRLSVAAARGLALSLAIPAIGVSSLEAQALDLPRPVLSSIDARRDQLFVQVFLAEETTQPALCVPGRDVLPRMDAQLCVGHRADEIAVLITAKATQSVYALPEAIARIALHRLAQVGTKPAARPKPLYIKAPDAAPPRNPAPEILP